MGKNRMHDAVIKLLICKLKRNLLPFFSAIHLFIFIRGECGNNSTHIVAWVHLAYLFIMEMETLKLSVWISSLGPCVSIGTEYVCQKMTLNRVQTAERVYLGAEGRRVFIQLFKIIIIIFIFIGIKLYSWSAPYVEYVLVRLVSHMRPNDKHYFRRH